MLVSDLISKGLLRALGIVLLALACAAPALAQGAGAAIEGTVLDPQGAALPGVTLTLRNQESGVARVTKSEADGRYRFFALPPGRYALKVEHTGFARVEVSDLILNIGLLVTRDFTLKVRTMEETVTVTGEVPLVDTSKSEVAGVVTQQQIETLPVNTRQYLNLALLMPGTSQDGARPFYNNVTIGGAASFYSSGFLVDGVTNTWAEQGEPRQNFPQGAVQEFKVHTTQFKAEYGLAMGGLVTVVTKSGTNQFHGEAFEYFRDKTLNRMNKFEQERHDKFADPKPDFRRNQFGISLGGPIVRDKTHYYGSFERTQTDEFLTVNTGRPEFYSAVEGIFPKPSHTNLYLARADHQINARQTLFARYAQEDEKRTCFQCGGTVAANSGFDQTIPRRAVVVGHTWILSPRLLNDFRFQYAYSMYQIAPAGTPIFTEIGKFATERLNKIQRRLSFPSLRWGGNFSELGPEHRRQVKDTVSLNRGSHDLKFGVDFSHIPFSDDNPSNYAGTYTFGTDQLFNPSDPASIANLRNAISFSMSIPPVLTEVPTRHLAWFVQDDWKLRRNLTLNLGLRWDRQFGSFNEDLDPRRFPKPIPFIDPKSRGDKNNFGPRFGLAWDLWSNGRSVVRAGYGIYYDNIRTLVNFGEWRNLAQFNIIISSPSYPDPFQGQDPLKFVSTSPPDITILSNKFVNPYSQQYSAGLTQQIGGNFAVHVDTVYVYALRDRRTVDINLRDPALGRRPLPEWGRINQIESGTRAKYRALYLRLDKRYSRRHQFLVSYTLADGKDNNPAGRITEQANYALDWGPSDVNRRNTLVASGSVLLPYGMTFGAIWTVRSGLPFSAIAGRDINGDGFVSDYVPGTHRNQGNRNLDLALVNAWRARFSMSPIPSSQINSTRFNSVDVRLTKPFTLRGERKLELTGQVFNVFGADNLLEPFTTQVTNALSGSFGRILTARPRQQAELAVRFVW